ncbi:MAG: hypothetical protein MSA57_00095 [Ruminococcus sp.]|nr:hypothetical protein [Ruminococcus sp.]
MIKSGFYDSINHDRLYGADDFSDYFEGLISDGIYAGIGKEFRVFADGSTMGVQVDTGRAKILNKYVRNTDILEVEIDAADSENPRWDAVCVSVNLDEAYRNGYIDVHKGTPAADPKRPDVPDTNAAKLFVLAYVYVPAQATVINAENVNDNRGAANCPYVVGITGTENIVNVVQEAATNAQSQITATVADAQTQISGFVTDAQSKTNKFVADAQSQIDTDLTTQQTQFNNFLTDSETDLQNLQNNFNTWWDNQKQNKIKLLENTRQYIDKNAAGSIQITSDRYSLDDEIAGTAVMNVYRNGLRMVRYVDYTLRYSEDRSITWVDFNTANKDDVIVIQILKISS